MIHIARWKIISVIAVCVLALLYSLPNVVPSSARGIFEKLPSWMPNQTVNLGLDLQGGSYLLLQVELDEVLKSRSEDLVDTARPELREAKVKYTRYRVGYAPDYS